MLLNDFATLENILDNVELIKKPSIREAIMKSADKLKINYKIIKLGNTEELPYGKQELEYSYDGITTNEVLKGIGCY